MPPRYTPARLALTAVSLLYIFGGAAYLAYGYVNDTGLSGWLNTWQMQAFGEASRGLTQAGNFVVWLLGLMPFLWLLAKLNRKENFTPQFPAPYGVPSAPPRPAQSVAHYQPQFPPPAPGAYPGAAAWPLRSRLIAAGVVLAITGAVYLYFAQRDARLATQPVRQLDLSETQTLPPDAELANIRGVVAANYLFVVEEKGSSRGPVRHSYAPLLPATWQPGQPVRYVLKTQALAYADPRTQQVAWLDSGRAFLATYDGRLSANDLPTYVAQDYAQRHLTLASPYYVLDDEAVYDGHAVLSSELTRWMILGCGLLFAVMLVLRRGYR